MLFYGGFHNPIKKLRTSPCFQIIQGFCAMPFNSEGDSMSESILLNSLLPPRPIFSKMKLLTIKFRIIAAIFAPLNCARASEFNTATFLFVLL